MFISFVPQTDGLIPLIRKNMSKPKKNCELCKKTRIDFLLLSYYRNRKLYDRKLYLSCVNDAGVFYVNKFMNTFKKI